MLRSEARLCFLSMIFQERDAWGYLYVANEWEFIEEVMKLSALGTVILEW